ncbi:unnamed protein product [Polarella glacialis]|uniref:Divinyl chlorophyllide a 8-vinyl-reductase, chloroplastic n=1 Tax=Polarella glacialis TaxID=89957 RepID=A0A813GMK3_POLGL|nr:unnamed protein product [Polarella glacialis]CAE8733411.1 unnamed protein product [Polarella glacialis]
MGASGPSPRGSAARASLLGAALAAPSLLLGRSSGSASEAFSLAASPATHSAPAVVASSARPSTGSRFSLQRSTAPLAVQAPASEGLLFGSGCALGLAAVALRAARRATRSGRRHGRAARAAVSAPLVANNVAGLDGPKMRVVVFGGTGYIGRAAVLELAARGHSVIVCTRSQSGMGSKQSVGDVEASFEGMGDVTVVNADVSEEASIASFLRSMDPPVQGAVCCLASRSGGREDSFKIDHAATVNCMKACRDSGLQHFVLLSAVCVQRPILAFQEAKLLAEAFLREESEKMAFSIVQPTAYFKSLLGQVKGVAGGAPFVMFGDGTEVRCKPISEQDLASFMADCFWDPSKRNVTLPIGGPGRALSFKEQGELLFSLVGREPNYICVPYSVFDFVQGILDFIAGLFPSQSDLAEYGRIGRYYAEQSMLVLDPKTGKYSEELTPSYGRTDLRAFMTEVLEDSSKLDAQKLGDQGLGARVGMGD